MKAGEDILEKLLDFIVYEQSFSYIENDHYVRVVKVNDILNKVKQLQAEQETKIKC